MSFWDIEPSDWFKKYFHGRSGFDDVFRSFDEMRNRMEREFEKGMFGTTRPLISSEREPLVDISTTDKEIKVVVEMPGVNKENIKINAYDSTLEVTATDTEGTTRKYHETIELPEGADLATAKSKYNNGILEITFNKKDKSKPKGKEIKIE